MIFLKRVTLKIIRSRWIFILRIGSAAIIIGGAIFLLAFAAKAGPAVSIIGLILLGIALALLTARHLYDCHRSVSPDW